MGDSFDPSPEEKNIVLIDARTLRKAETFIAGCEFCRPSFALMPFDSLLDQVTDNDPAMTEYILAEPAKCPRCRRRIFEKTLVELAP
jgi:hypothetical protein